ncbi:uncharacterized protein FPRO_04123 [Fusarium proliferatum ET1]|uniref:Uncharacterized protein n=1 Tax=Fusarium proliferatum (strain ET1) TaxID=1227346 RepID=A0A1L7W7R7_FUSPR|nr:uncharacterized protein FPRO_04123 [Fusarium proliferatum ET1]CZR48551.1 uncharacterized protein FPRO_04123 [Fusarium proliferatum ET1]
MTDKRIALKLGWRLRTSVKMGKRVGDAARSVYRLSRQWPWDLVAGFAPQKWGIEILESMRVLFYIIHRVFPAHEHQNDFHTDVQEDEDGWLDYIGYDNFDDEDEDDGYADIATPAKRSRTPSSPSLSPKRARTAEPPEPRPQTIAGITNSLQSLHAQKQKELEEVTNSLDEIAVSIQASEAAQIKHINEKVDKLTSDVKAYETEREKILKARNFMEHHHEVMRMEEDELAKRLQRYTSDLEECDKLIAQAEADVYKELDQIKQMDVNLADEEKRLEGRVKEVLEEVRHCSVVETLMRLGPGGMAKLLGRLEGNGVELVEMAESIRIMNEAEE